MLIQPIVFQLLVNCQASTNTVVSTTGSKLIVNYQISTNTISTDNSSTISSKPVNCQTILLLIELIVILLLVVSY